MIKSRKQLIVSPLKPVPDSAHRDDARRLRRVRLDLLAQPTHVHVHSAAVAVEVIAPHARQQQIAREHRALMAHQLSQQAELLGAQHQLLVAQKRAAADQVQASGRRIGSRR